VEDSFSLQNNKHFTEGDKQYYLQKQKRINLEASVTRVEVEFLLIACNMKGQPAKDKCTGTKRSYT